MFFLKRNKPGTELKLTVSGMHCSSCALSIDNALEDIPGVLESHTNYAKGETVVRVNDSVDVAQLRKVIAETGYSVV